MFKRKDSVSSKTELLDESLDAIVLKYKAELDELGEKFPVLKDDPFLLYRFIRARPNLKQSAEMISNFLAFSEKNNFAKIKEHLEKIKDPSEFPYSEQVVKHYPHVVLVGYSKNGSPISFEHTGRADPAGMLRSVTQENMNEYVLYQLLFNSTALKRLSIEKNRLMRLYHFMDLQGLGFHHVHQGFLLYVKTMSKMSQDNFPEQVEKIFVLNAPWIFQTVLNFVKGAISAATLAKLTFVKDIKTGMDQLREHFDDETIEKINQLCLKDFDKKASSDFSSVSISAGSKFRTYLPLPPHEEKEEFIALNAEFSIEKKNITINLFGRVEDSVEDHALESDSLIETFLLSSSDKLTVRNFSISGKFKSVILEFDNSKSILTSKQHTMSISMHGYTIEPFAELEGVDLHDVNLSKADLNNINFSKANLARANVSGADLYGADFSGANLSGANLRDADLRGARFCGCDLSHADLTNAIMRDADLSGANLKSAKLLGTILTGADLRNAVLVDAILKGAVLTGANRNGTDERGALF